MASTNDPRPFGLTQPVVLREIALAGSLGAAGIASAPTVSIGSGAPSSLTRPRGSLYLRTNGAADTTAYVNTDGGTTWAALQGGNEPAMALVAPDLSAEAEAGNAIQVNIGLIDLNGDAAERVQRLACRLYDANLDAAVVGDWTMAETGGGSEVSTTGKPALLIDTNATGEAILTVTDVSGVYAGPVYLEVVPVSADGSTPGVPAMITLTFA